MRGINPYNQDRVNITPIDRMSKTKYLAYQDSKRDAFIINELHVAKESPLISILKQILEIKEDYLTELDSSRGLREGSVSHVVDT